MEELFYNVLSDKVLLAVLLLVGGVVFVVKRLIVSSIEKNTAIGLIRKIKRNPTSARTIADNLDIPYSHRERFLAPHFEKLKEYIGARTMIGSYQVLYKADVSPSEFLVFTLISFDDFDVGVTGTGTDVRKNSYVTFLLGYDHNAQRLTIYSDVYATSAGKFQRAGFLSAILTGSG